MLHNILKHLQDMTSLNFKIGILLSMILSITVNARTNEQLGTHKKLRHDIEVLRYEPSAEDFYKNFVHTSNPVLIRPRRRSWGRMLKSWNNTDILKKMIGHYYGKAFKRLVWTKSWPLERRLKFRDFITSLPNDLYWDSVIPVQSPIMQYIPLPQCIDCKNLIKTIVSTNLLYTSYNTSSVFHQDGADNLFFQISGSKRWLLANYSYSKMAYANDYDVEPGLSPINPEAVDLSLHPMAADIEFSEVITQPGDMLYVPQYMWHHVRSFDWPNIGFNIWLNIFNSDELENVYDIIDYNKKFAQHRREMSSDYKCLRH